MEVIDVIGYTTEEKTQIASRHLLPKLLKEHGLSGHDLEVPLQTVVAICEQYTREPGVRTLERQMAAVCRAAAVRIMEKEAQKEVCDAIPVLVSRLIVRRNPNPSSCSRTICSPFSGRRSTRAKAIWCCLFVLYISL